MKILFMNSVRVPEAIDTKRLIFRKDLLKRKSSFVSSVPKDRQEAQVAAGANTVSNQT